MDASLDKISKNNTSNFPTNSIYEELQEVAHFICQKGWGERNAGNISYRNYDLGIMNLQSDSASLSELRVVIGNHRYKTPHSALHTPNSEHQYELLITQSGSKFRDIAKDPIKHCCKVSLSTNSVNCQMSAVNSTPSSELPTHLLIHQYLSQHRPSKQCIIHTHPTHLIAFSHKYYHYSKEEANALLTNIMPEVAMFVQKGAGFVDLLPPGSDALAQATLSELTHHDVIIWKKHGCIAVGETFWEAIDMIDILDKAAYIQLLVNN